MDIKKLIFFTIFYSFAAFSECPEWLKIENAPACPEGKGNVVLDDSYPAIAYVLGDGRENLFYGSVEDIPEDTPYFPNQVVRSILANRIENPPFMFIQSTDAEFSYIKLTLGKLTKDFAKERRQKLLGSLVQIPISEEDQENGNTYHYFQDIFQTANNLETGQATSYQFPMSSRIYDKTHERVLGKMKEVLADCGWTNEVLPKGDRTTQAIQWYDDFSTAKANEDREKILELRKDHERLDAYNSLGNHHLGGNVEGLPGGLCLFGSSFEDDPIADKLCSDKSKQIHVDTSWLGVGHVDEIVGVLPLSSPKEGECPVILQIADQQTAFDLLASKPEEKLLDEAYGVLVNPDNPEKAHREFICAIMSNSKKVEENGEDSTEHLGFLELIINLLSVNIANAGIEISVIDGADDTAGVCDPMAVSNKEFLEAMQSHPYYQQIVKSLNTRLSEIEKKIKERIESQLSCKMRDSLKTPYVFGFDVNNVNVASEREFPGFKASDISTSLGTGAFSLFSNSTNAHRVEQGLVRSANQNSTFEGYLENKYAELGMGDQPIDSTAAHLGNGNLHCLVNSVRLCKPRGAE